mgnify:CR=1 FL=1
MKIAYLSRGNSVYDRRLLEKMIDRGHRVYFISYFPSERVNVRGVENYHFDYTSMHRFPKFISLQTAMHLRNLLKRIQPDVLHTGWIQDHGFLGALSGFHPTISMPWGSDVLLRPYDSVWAMWRTRFTLRRADMVACDAQSVKGQVIKLSGCSPNKIAVFPLGIDLGTFHPKSSSEVRKRLGWDHKRVLICTRNFDIKVHGVEYFILAIPTVLERYPDVGVILVGSGPLEHEYRKLVSKLGLDDVVHFAGWLNEIQMAEYLNAADIYVSTSLSDGTSCSLLEAMAIGLPVVVTDVPSYFEWVEDGVNGYIVPKKDNNKLVEAIVSLLENTRLQREMREHNLKIANERADWEKNFTILEDMYRNLVSAY